MTAGPIRMAFSSRFSGDERSIEPFHPPLDGLPGIVPAGHVTRVKARLAQCLGGLAANVEAVDAECDNRIGLRQLADPFVHTLRIAPGGAVHDVLGSGAVVPRARVDDLYGL